MVMGSRGWRSTICRVIVKGHGKRIWAESVVDEIAGPALPFVSSRRLEVKQQPVLDVDGDDQQALRNLCDALSEAVNLNASM